MKSSTEHLQAAAACLRSAGFSLYLDSDMGGATFSDNVMRGDQPAGARNLQPWCVMPGPDGTLSMSVAVRGGEHGLYPARSSKPDEYAIEQLGQHIFAALRAAGMKIRRIRSISWDSGFGTRDVHYEVTYAPGGPWS